MSAIGNPSSITQNGFGFEDLSYDDLTKQVQGQNKTEHGDGLQQANALPAANELTENVGVSGQSLLKGAKINSFGTVSFGKDESVVPARHSISKTLENAAHAIGRALMKFCHAIYNAFAAPAGFKSRAELNRGVTGMSGGNLSCAGDCNFEETTNTPIVDVAKAFGLRGNVDVKPFTDSEIDEIRNCNFNLTDIDQDPTLQDCWFLSSLTSFLATKGREGVAELITIPPNQEGTPKYAQVKLGDNSYKVPLGDIRGDGKTGASSSKPWVRMMETAMLMHMMYLNDGGVWNSSTSSYVSKSLHLGAADVGLNALLGAGLKNGFEGKSIDAKAKMYKHNDFNLDAKDAKLAKIKTALGLPTNDGQPGGPKRCVVLGSPSSNTASLKYGISPKHAVAVLGVVESGTGDKTKTFLQVLDPYNRSVLVDSDVLQEEGAAIFIES